MKARVRTSISVERVSGTRCGTMPWCCVKRYHHKAPKWMFWRHDPDTCKVYGPFSSRNQAEKFAYKLANPI